MISESDVVEVVKKHFEGRGFSCNPSPPHDLVCVSADQAQRWVVEAKGETSEPGTDVQTGLGQLLMGMREPTWQFALALPYTPKYIHQARKVPAWVRAKLQMHVLLVEATGQVTVIAPTEPLPES